MASKFFLVIPVLCCCSRKVISLWTDVSCASLYVVFCGMGGEEEDDKTACGQFLLITLCLDSCILIGISVYRNIKAIM